MVKALQIIFPGYIQLFLKRIGILLVLMPLSRIIFYVFNRHAFPQAQFIDFLTGIWFDIITIGLCYLPYLVLYLIPFRNRENKYYRRFFTTLFIIIASLILVANLVDVEYFKYTGKRSTADLFSILSAGSDLKQLIGSFISDFWYLILFFLLFEIFLIFVIKRIKQRETHINFWLTNVFCLLFYIGVFVILGRGGFNYRPVGLIEASKYTKVQNTSLVMNTMFTMLKSFGNESLEEKHYFSKTEARKYFNPVQQSEAQNLLPENTNVVILILESFGNEFVGTYSGEESFTPFLDSILANSWYFENAFANGKKSIEAMPAIVSSIPSLMDNPYISSNYATNRMESLVQILGKKGYSSAFYHGATNGSMRFDAFAAQAGYEQYFGRKEYKNDKHHDKTWGILDEYFNPWTARKLSELKEPFIGTLFTLSSHHPYFIPQHMRNKVKKGSQAIAGSINYGDYALRKFFEEAKKQDWYENTIFVICADHTPGSQTSLYNLRTQLYRIPIAFYHPNKTLLPIGKDPRIFQHMDIMPTLLDLLNINTKYYAFGQSIFKEGDRSAIAYLDGTYHYFQDRFLMNFSNDKARNLFNYQIKSSEPADSIAYFPERTKKYTKRIQSIIQQYNYDLNNNKTFVE